MASVDTLSVPVLPHLYAPSPPSLRTQIALKLLVQKVINSNSHRPRLERQISLHTPTRPLPGDSFYLLRPMEKEDLPGVIALMKEEGWNINFDNLTMVFNMQPEAYFVAATLSGHIVGHVSGYRLNDSVGVVAYLLVSSRHQRQGLGRRLAHLGAEALGTPTVVFYSLEDAISFHKSNKFETRRFQAFVRNFCLDAKDFDPVPDNEKIRVVPAQKVDFDKLNQYDVAVHGIERAEYLANWIISKDKIAYAAVDSSSGKVVGYIALSHHADRWDVAPLYADSDDIAQQLLKKASQQIGEPIQVFVRIPADSNEGIELFSTMRDIQHKRVLYLMSDQPLPNFTSDKVYSLSTVCYGLK